MARERAIEIASEVHRSEGCEARIDVGPGPMVTLEVRGRLDRPIADALSARLGALAALHGGVVAFHDWSGATGCDPHARDALQRLLAGSASVEESHVLVGPGLVGMGMAVTAALGGRLVRSYVERGSWDRERIGRRRTGARR